MSVLLEKISILVYTKRGMKITVDAFFRSILRDVAISYISDQTKLAPKIVFISSNNIGLFEH